MSDRPGNCVQDIARAAGRGYITPEDVGEALRRGIEPAQVRFDVLEVLGRRMGAEDGTLCAYVAWKGLTRDESEEESGE